MCARFPGTRWENCYTELGRTEFDFLTRPFAAPRCGRPSGMVRRGPVHRILFHNFSATRKQTQMILTSMYSRLCDEARTRKFRSWSDYTGKLLGHLRIQNCAVKVCRDQLLRPKSRGARPVRWKTVAIGKFLLIPTRTPVWDRVRNVASGCLRKIGQKLAKPSSQ